jgi:hypothetical protein
MSKGEKKGVSAQNQPKLSPKEKAKRKADKQKAKELDAGPPLPPRR